MYKYGVIVLGALYWNSRGPKIHLLSQIASTGLLYMPIYSDMLTTTRHGTTHADPFGHALTQSIMHADPIRTCNCILHPMQMYSGVWPCPPIYSDMKSNWESNKHVDLFASTGLLYMQIYSDMLTTTGHGTTHADPFGHALTQSIMYADLFGHAIAYYTPPHADVFWRMAVPADLFGHEIKLRIKHAWRSLRERDLQIGAEWWPICICDTDSLY